MNKEKWYAAAITIVSIIGIAFVSEQRYERGFKDGKADGKYEVMECKELQDELTDQLFVCLEVMVECADEKK